MEGFIYHSEEAGLFIKENEKLFWGALGREVTCLNLHLFK